jgi:hypothetical protein
MRPRKLALPARPLSPVPGLGPGTTDHPGLALLDDRGEVARRVRKTHAAALYFVDESAEELAARRLPRPRSYRTVAGPV